MINKDSSAELVPLYALDALEGDERAQFEVHLDTCDSCLKDLAKYREVAAAFVPDRQPPDGVWARVVADISDRDSPLTPTTEAGKVISLRERQYRRFAWIASAVAVAAMVFALIGVASRPSGDEFSIPAAAERAAAEPGAFVGDFLVGEDSVAEVILTTDGRGYIVPSGALEPLGSDRTYQLWVITSDEVVISGGVLGADPQASSFTWTGEVAGFALTREVAGGVITSEGDVVSVLAEA